MYSFTRRFIHNFLNTQVEAIATLIFNEVLKKTPQNPWAHAAQYLNDSRSLDRIAKFPRSQNSITLELVGQNANNYATKKSMIINTQADHQSGQSEDQVDEQDDKQDDEHDDEQIDYQDDE